MSEQCFKLVKNEDGDYRIKFRRKKNDYIYITPESIGSDSWDIYFQWGSNRQEILDRCYEYLIMNEYLEE